MATPSLLLIPNRYKSGVLYSQLPESGAGDFDVVRATTATRVNASGLLESVASGVPRLDFGVSGCPVLLVEASGTNLLLHSNDFSNAAWQKDNTPLITGGQLSPTVAGNEGWEIEDNSNTEFRGAFQVINKINNTNTTSVHIRKTTSTPTYFPILGLRYSAGIATGYYIINTTTGDANFVSIVGDLNPSYNVESIGDFWRCEFTGTDPTAAQPNVVSEFYPAASIDGVTLSSAAIGSQVIFGFQIEEGNEATSYIPTTTAAVARNADVMTVEPPVGTTLITTTFEDDTTQEIVPSGTFTIPNGRIKSIVMT